MAPRSEVNRNDEIMTAWSASAASSVGLAPTRSATIPVPIRPKMEESPEAPRMPAAAILVIPWSMAWETMWKSGPEWAVQQAKWVSEMAQKGQERQTPSAAPPGVWVARGLERGVVGSVIGAGGLRRSRAAGITMSQAMSPRTTKAVRHSYSFMKSRDSGDSARMPKPLPAEATAEAMPRLPRNHFTAVT